MAETVRVGQTWQDGKGRTWVVRELLPFGIVVITANGGTLYGEIQRRSLLADPDWRKAHAAGERS